MAPNPKRARHDSQAESGYLSDDSDFYGPTSTIQSYTTRASQFNPTHWKNTHKPCLNTLAATNLATRVEAASVPLHNPYEGQGNARQLVETVEDFLHRLPPASTSIGPGLDWIFVANPYRDAWSSKGGLGSDSNGDGHGKVAEFEVLGAEILYDLTGLREWIEREKKGQAQASITRAFNVEKEGFVKKLLDGAKELGCTSGKWMLFCPTPDVNAVWSVIARATAQNDLGIAAKVAPYDGDPRKDRLICVYTKDFTNRDDVTRVLKKLKALGLFEMKGRPLYYKCDAYTYLNIKSDNEWGIKASLYNSKELLDPKQKAGDGNGIGKGKKPEGYFHKKKRETDDWKALENE